MPQTRDPGFFNSLRFRYGLGLAVFLGAAGYLLWDEHEAHILGYLPLILILGACLGMHFFMHGSHGGHGSQGGHDGHGNQGSQSDQGSQGKAERQDDPNADGRD